MGAGGAYRERIIDGELAERLSAIGAVLIEGPKACGKTESAIQHAATTYRFDVDQAARNAASLAPSLVLDNPTPVLLDEWRVVFKTCRIRSAALSMTAPPRRVCTSSLARRRLARTSTGTLGLAASPSSRCAPCPSWSRATPPVRLRSVH